ILDAPSIETLKIARDGGAPSGVVAQEFHRQECSPPPVRGQASWVMRTCRQASGSVVRRASRPNTRRLDCSSMDALRLTPNATLGVVLAFLDLKYLSSLA